MNNLTFTYSKNTESKYKEKMQLFLNNFIENHPRSDFLKNTFQEKESIDKILKLHQDKEHFVHVGIGGSNLGTQSLIHSLCGFAPISFLANLDADEIHETLDNINLSKTLFYIVSKSGETLETLSIFNIIVSKLEEKLGCDFKMKDFFVFCTDPEKGSLRKMGEKQGIPTLSLPTHIGGRFSVLTNVSYLPLKFCGVDIQRIEEAQNLFLSQLRKDPKDLFKVCEYLFDNYQNGKQQTVFMPYSSKLKYLSLWFVQLWAESLGKNHVTHGPIGFTPLFAYGSTDQHSQMQLFMDGPKDKFFIFLEVLESKYKTIISKKIEHPKIETIDSLNLDHVLNTQLEATLKTFSDRNIPYVKLSIPKKTEESITEILLFFETLTALMGEFLEVDPFDQPGVEWGKIAFNEIISKQKSV